jgi:hypothetical protein
MNTQTIKIKIVSPKNKMIKIKIVKQKTVNMHLNKYLINDISSLIEDYSNENKNKHREVLNEMYYQSRTFEQYYREATGLKNCDKLRMTFYARYIGQVKRRKLYYPRKGGAVSWCHMLARDFRYIMYDLWEGRCAYKYLYNQIHSNSYIVSDDDDSDSDSD